MCTVKVWCSFYRENETQRSEKTYFRSHSKLVAEPAKELKIPGSRTLSIILNYLPYDTMKLEKKIFHAPGLTNTTSLRPRLSLHHADTS